MVLGKLGASQPTNWQFFVSMDIYIVLLAIYIIL
jgi:hypothetical protein